MSALFWLNTICLYREGYHSKPGVPLGNGNQKWAAAFAVCRDHGHMLADVSGEEVERYLVENKLVEASDAATDVPTNAACANEQHEGVVKLNF